jgi:hypothetical protein
MLNFHGQSCLLIVDYRPQGFFQKFVNILIQAMKRYLEDHEEAFGFV